MFYIGSVYSIILIFTLTFQAIHSALWESKTTEVNDIYTDYGVDVSTPIHHFLDKKKNPWFYKQYQDLMAACYKFYDKISCDATERARLQMSIDQPRSQHNYTDIGFMKTRAPKRAYEAIIEFYNKFKGNDVAEDWPHGNTYVNNWEAPTTMLNFENRNFRGGFDTKQVIWDAVQPVIEEWVGRKVVPVSLYGIRIYYSNAVLATHVDRLPLISSAIIQVDQDLDEPWPIEVYGRNGKATNVSLLPGDMVLYESHSTLHGRPFKLKGRFYANVFVHFAPVDHFEQQKLDEKLREERAKHPIKSPDVIREENEAAKEIEAALKVLKGKRIGGHEQSQHDEEVINKHKQDIRNENSKKVLDENDIDENTSSKDDDTPKGQTDLHIAAGEGSLQKCIKILGNKQTDIITARDENGWQAIHEAARGGHLDVLKYLIEKGADVTAKTSEGGTPLWWAKRSLHEGHQVILYLESIGAPEEESTEI